MLISLKWIREFVDLPDDLDPHSWAEAFTCTTAEVEGVEHVTCQASGLVTAQIETVEPAAGEGQLYLVRANLGDRQVQSVTVAEGLSPGDLVIYAPPGASLPGIGEVTVRETNGIESVGMIVPGDALGLVSVGQRAVWLPPSSKPGEPIDMSLFTDWIIEVDNKSITHRPDLWGHYGIAREMAAMYSRPLKQYPVTAIEELQEASLPEIPIEIDDPQKCPRYSALGFTGVRVQPSPLWMQVRLAHIGLRPIDILVDLTNYIMAELGQPMHAFDAANVDRIEVATAEPGEKFTTLDNVQRTMPEGALMIQCQRRSIALAGIMGGADTEVTPRTTELLLESANFEPATIRKCAAALGHRTDASARFEKSQDPHNTTLGIQRFVELARPELPDLKFTSRLSDSFPEPPEPTVVRVDPEFVSRYIGREIPIAETTRILEAIDFDVKQADGMLEVTVPTFRATKDIAIEADVIEEVARFVGYGSIDPVLPEVTVRYAEPDPLSQLERRILSLFCIGSSHAEIHRYIWFDNDWLKQLNYVPQETLTLRNPAASGMEKLRTTLIPGMLASVDLDRHTFDSFELLEIGSVFPTRKGNAPEDVEQRHLGLAVVAPGRKAKHEDAVLDRLKTDLETFAQQLLGASLKFTDVPADMPWEHEIKTAAIHLDSMKLGRISVLPQACKRRIDEHLAAWSIAICELNLSMLSNYQAPVPRLRPIPVFPRIDVDFSLLADASSRYQQTESALGQFDHPLLRALAFVDSYEGGSVPAGKRSFTFRATIGDPSRTLTEDDIQAFRSSFIDYAGKHGLTLRQK